MPRADKIFMSYSFSDLEFVSCVADLLRRQQVPHYFYTAHYSTGQFNSEIRAALDECNGFVLFRGKKLGAVQRLELTRWLESPNASNREWVRLTKEFEQHPTANSFCVDFDPIRLSESQIVTSPQTEALVCAREVLKRLFPERRWRSELNLPETYLFDYEKDVIDRYAAGGGVLSVQPDEEHCPSVWPTVCKAGESAESSVYRADPLPESAESSVYRANPLPESAVGSFRTKSDVIVVDARAKNLIMKSSDHPSPESSIRDHEAGRRMPLTFPEAGPRESIRFPRPGYAKQVKVGVLVSGGIAPGINAVLRGIVNRHTLYARPPRRGEVVSQPSDRVDHDLDVYGITSGFRGLLTDGYEARRLLRRLSKTDPKGQTDQEVVEQAQAGGSILRTSRADELLSTGTTEDLDRVIRQLTGEGEPLDILYVIGGDGSMRAAHALQLRANEQRLRLSVVAVPKTMDNDVLWVWQSFGFLSAVERAREAISHLHVEARSNPRVCVMQLFGSDSGFVASHAALASGVCDYVLIPEVRFSMKTVIDRVIEKLDSRHQQRGAYCMVVMAETAIPRDFDQYVMLPQVGLSGYPDQGRDEQTEFGALNAFVARGGRVRGQTPDALRSAALKLIAGSILAGIQQHGSATHNKYWERFRVFSNEPRHLIRAIPPSSADVIFGERLGALAVDAAMAGYSDCMVSQWLTEFVLVPLNLVVLGRKRVPPRGFFWRSVLASTGQPDEHDSLSDWPRSSRSSLS